MSNRKKLTEEQKKHFNEARKKTCLERYGNPNYNNMDKNRATKKERYGDENYNNQEKHEETCLERYGQTHHNKVKEISNKISKKKKSKETQKKYENTMMERYGVTNCNLSPIIREKYTNTLLKNYGVENPLKNKDIYNKHIQTMKQNNSFIKSKNEEELYQELCEEYGAENVIRQYRDEERYPFDCDFYVKSKDLFIEVNIHPSHGTHPFNPENEDDIVLLEKLKNENTEWSNMIIDVWSVRDYKKQQIAKENNLNYITIYSN